MRNTIKHHNDFIMPLSNPTAKSAYFLVRAKPAKFVGDARYGLTVTKRTFKFAVQRNRAKRLLREWIRYNQQLLRPDWDYVFVARHDILDATRDSGREAMRKALRYIAKQEIDATVKK